MSQESGSPRCCAFAVGAVGALCTLAGCGSPPPADPPAATVPTIEVVRVAQQPVNVVLSMPGQLDPYEAVAIYPKVTGFVKRIRVDRGSHVHAGDLLAELEAPEFLAQRAEAQSKVQAAEAQLAATRAKADADSSTYDKLKAAAAKRQASLRATNSCWPRSLWRRTRVRSPLREGRWKRPDRPSNRSRRSTSICA